MSKTTKWVLYFFGFLLFIAFMKGCSQPPLQETQSASQDTNSQPQIASEVTDNNALVDKQLSAAESSKASNWVYDESLDEMRGESSYFATNASLNTVDLGFPYGNDIKLNIILRNDYKNGDDIMFVADRGQIFCSYRDCSVTVKFDNADVQNYEASEAEAGSSEVLFLANNISSFAKKISQSKQLIVEVNFYDHGAEQFKFNISDLEWSAF
ncbi:hypothetical protein ACS8E3_07630 [Psychrobacter sp. 2Y5]|uniref:hypothetical protein n=1 Tax=unclassified Psychrobacter TaxID=196806 RepID=UPI003F478305